MLNSAKVNIQLFFSSPVFLACVFSWLSAQFIKTAINVLVGKVHSLKELIDLMFWRTGGMPSSHSAVVAAIATSIGFRSGINSDVFILALGFFFVTIRDAVGVRRSSGMQAKKLNELGTRLDEHGLVEFKKIKEVQGHTPMEVLVGCILGFFTGLAFATL